MQEMKEMAADGVIVGFDLDPFLIAREMMPIEQASSRNLPSACRQSRARALDIMVVVFGFERA